jgi:hypothetical protein
MKDLHLRFIQKFKDIDISRQYLSKILRDNIEKEQHLNDR